MHQDIEKLLNAAKEKGSMTERQREIILNKAQQLGEDMAEVEFMLEDIFVNKQKEDDSPQIDLPKPTPIENSNEQIKPDTHQDGIPTGNRFVSVEHDSFENKTITRSTTLEYSLSARRLKLTETATFKFRQVKSPQYSFLLIDVHFTSKEAAKVYSTGLEGLKEAAATNPGDWAFLREGKLSIKINDTDTIHLPAHESDSDVTRQSFTDAMACEEMCYYEIDKKILEKICEAKTIKMRLTGGRAQWELEGSDFRTLAQAFYNGCFDNTKYTGEVQHATDVETKKKTIKRTGCAIEIIAVFLFAVMCNVYKDNQDDHMFAISIFLIIAIVAAIVSHFMRKNLK